MGNNTPCLHHLLHQNEKYPRFFSEHSYSVIGANRGYDAPFL
ncbi:hypothetical protein HNR55_003389 [Acetobacter lovaniensis]|uniref:Uncharacterized protein n=1 Tax=Acetobacter lovaniensis TaxID=104100 RepID=A0A841QKN2_9PROT|nr:hypothetical protein [Acetobacter lovaniensis]